MQRGTIIFTPIAVTSARWLLTCRFGNAIERERGDPFGRPVATAAPGRVTRPGPGRSWALTGAGERQAVTCPHRRRGDRSEDNLVGHLDRVALPE